MRGRKGWGENGFEGFGGYMRAKISKLENQFSSDAQRVGKDGIFKDVAIFVNGYTDPSADELKRLMMMNGGIFHHYYNEGKTTHIIASNLANAKIRKLKGDEKICSPDWIIESLKAEKLLDYRDYLLYNKPKGYFKRKDANDDNFLGEFYENSRLHHISTMGANFKKYINELREETSDFPLRKKLIEQLKTSDESHLLDERVIMHIDMDCFFVSVGLLTHPELRGQPVAVTHSKGNDVPTSALNKESRQKELQMYSARMNRRLGRNDDDEIPNFEIEGSLSEIASCSYEARRAGVKNGMFVGQARKLCPNLKTIPYNFEEYNKVAFTLYETVAQYTLDIQAVSCDEMFVDLTDLLKSCGICDIIELAEFLRNEIFSKTGCKASVGLGPSPLLARLATRKAKPDGVFRINGSEASDFMTSIPVSDLPGVGRKIAMKLEHISTCGDLQKKSMQFLQKEFGSKIGKSLYDFCRGIDSRELELVHKRKSVSAEVNYGIRFANDDDVERFLTKLTSEVHSRLTDLKMSGKCVTLKVMVRAEGAPVETAKYLGHGVCDSHSKSSTLSYLTDDKTIIQREVLQLWRQMKLKAEDFRGLGIQISKLEEAKTSKPTSILQYINQPSTSKSKRISKREEEGLSFSQLDPEVLAQLPNDILEEVHCQYSRSFSQLDQEVLAELPEDILEEVRRQYSRKPITKPPTAFDVLMTSPTKSKVKKTSKTKKETKVIPKSEEETTSTDLPESSSKESEPESANLQGYTELKELRPLLKEWIDSTGDPTEVDETLVRTFIVDLIRERECQKVRLLLRFLDRHISKMKNGEKWKFFYSRTIEEVQIQMKATYGSILLL